MNEFCGANAKEGAKSSNKKRKDGLTNTQGVKTKGDTTRPIIRQRELEPKFYHA